MRSGRRKKTILLVLLILIATVGLVAAVYMVSVKNIRAAYELQISGYEYTIQQNSHKVFVANTDIKAGDVITEELLSSSEMLCTLQDGLFMEEDIGKMALVDIPSGEMMVKGFVTSTANSATDREVEYTCLYLSSSLKQGDFIDVRIRFSNGEDFIILSKKRVEAVSLASKECFLTVSEDEMQLMASAIVDSNIYGAVLYTTMYIQPSAQPASAITYLPRSETLAVVDVERLYELSYADALVQRGKLELRLGTASPVSDVSNFSSVTEREFSNVNGGGQSISGGFTENEE